MDENLLRVNLKIEKITRTFDIDGGAEEILNIK